MDPVLNKILENTYTLSQLKHRVRILREYLTQQLFTKNENSAIEAGDLNWLRSLGAEFFKQFNRDNYNRVLDNVGAYLKNLKPLIIYLAFEPTEEATRQIGLYLRKNFTGHPIFELKFDPQLVAGAALSLNGVYRDYSLRNKIADQKESILASFKKYLT